MSFSEASGTVRNDDDDGLASTDQDLPTYKKRDVAKESPVTEATQGNHTNNGTMLNIAVADLKKMKDAFDANATYLQAANDKIRSLEVENAKLRGQLLNRCQCSLSSSDIPLTVNEECPFYYYLEDS